MREQKSGRGWEEDEAGDEEGVAEQKAKLKGRAKKAQRARGEHILVKICRHASFSGYASL